MVYVMLSCSKTVMQHTKNCSGWNRLLVNPERHLRKNDCHNAWSIYLYHEVAHLPLQVEINCHDYIFTCQETSMSALFWQHMSKHIRLNPTYYVLTKALTGLLVCNKNKLIKNR